MLQQLHLQQLLTSSCLHKLPAAVLLLLLLLSFSRQPGILPLLQCCLSSSSCSAAAKVFGPGALSASAVVYRLAQCLRLLLYRVASVLRSSSLRLAAALFAPRPQQGMGLAPQAWAPASQRRFWRSPCNWGAGPDCTCNCCNQLTASGALRAATRGCNRAATKQESEAAAGTAGLHGPVQLPCGQT